MKTYSVTYRDEIEVTVQAENEDEAVSKAEDSSSWGFILGEGHKDLFEVEEVNVCKDCGREIEEGEKKCGRCVIGDHYA